MNTRLKAVRAVYKKYNREHLLPKNYIQIEDQIGNAGKIYRPGKYYGKVTLFRACKQPLGIIPDETLGWREFVGGELEIIEVPGHHGSIVTEPFVRVLAEELNRAIASTIAEDNPGNNKVRTVRGVSPATRL